MPRFPIYDAPTVAPNAAPNVYGRADTSAAEFGGLAAQGLADAGKKLETFADTSNRTATILKEEDDKAAVKFATSQYEDFARDTLFSTKEAAPGYYLSRGKDAVDRQAGVVDALEQRAKDIAAGITDPYQQRLFADVAKSHRRSLLDGVAAHAEKERLVYLDGASVAMVESAKADGANFYNSPDLFGQAYDRGFAEIANMGKRNGWASDVTTFKLRQYQSDFHKGAIERQAVHDPLGAAASYDRNKTRIDGREHAQLEKLLKVGTDKTQARDVALRLLAEPPPVVGGGFADRVVAAESGGRADARNPNSSAAGAGQFIASTWIDTIRAHRPELAAGKSDAEVLALRDDPALSREMVGAHASDNAAKLQAAGLPVNDGNLYLAHFAGADGAQKLLTADPAAKAETVLSAAAVAANPWVKGKTAGDMVAWAGDKMGRNSDTAPASGVRAEAQSVEMRLAGLLKSIDAHPGLSPEGRDMARSELLTRYHQIEAGKAALQKANYDRAIGIVNGAASPNISDIPSDVLAGLSQEQRMALGNIIEHRSKGIDPPPNPALYGRLSREAAEDPAAFLRRDLAALAGQMPNADLKHFMNSQMGISRKDAAALEKGAQWKRVLVLTENKLRAVGIDPRPADTDKAGAARMEAFQGAALSEIEAEEKRLGKPLSDDEIKKLLDAHLLTAGRVQGSGWFGSAVGETERLLFERKPGERVILKRHDDIPEKAREDITKDFEAERRRKPTREEMEVIYTSKMVGGR